MLHLIMVSENNMFVKSEEVQKVLYSMYGAICELQISFGHPGRGCEDEFLKL